MVMTRLPPGFRFHPTDVELVEHYLKRKVMGKAFIYDAISEIELYKYAPWDLHEKSLLRSKDLEWYFFCPRDKKYRNSSRAKRDTDIGHWKSTGKDRAIIHRSRTIGMKKTLVFHLGKAPKGERTDWVMYEYRLADEQLVADGFSQDAYVVCKIFNKSGAGPRNGEHHGAPFDEKEWDDDIAEDPTSLHHSSPISTLLDNPGPLSNVASEQPVASGVTDVLPNFEPSDDGLWLEELFQILDIPPVDGNILENIPDQQLPSQRATEASTSDPRGIYAGLEDLPVEVFESANYPQGIQNECNFFSTQSDFFPMQSNLYLDPFMELNDLFDGLGDKDFPL